MNAFGGQFKGPLKDFYEFCAERKEAKRREQDLKYSTPELQRDALLEECRHMLKVFGPYPKYGVELTVFNKFKEVYDEIERRK